MSGRLPSAMMVKTTSPMIPKRLHNIIKLGFWKDADIWQTRRVASWEMQDPLIWGA